MPDPHQPAGEPGGAGGQSSAPGGQSNADLIQSMLSRAVEGQVSEQREMTTALGEIRSQLLRMSQELAQMRMRSPQDEATDAQINTVTVEMREAVRFLSERLDGVTRMVAQRGEDLADIRTALTAIDAHVRSQAETIGVLSAGLQALPSYGERVSVLQDNLQTLHQQLAGIEQTLAAAPSDDGNGEVVARLAALEASLGSVVESAQSAVAPVVERLNAFDDGGEAHAALLSQVQSSASQLQQAIAGLHNRIDPLADDLSTIGAEITGLVESAADGAVLDSRITESVNDAVRGTEQRLKEHVDEAVLALAQTLLKPRGAGTAASPAESADAGATASEASEPAHGVGGFTSEPAAAEHPVPSAGAAGGTTWWERDLDEDAADIAAASDSAIPGSSDPSRPDDGVPDDWWEDDDEADEAVVAAEEPARSSALDAEQGDNDDETLGEIDDLNDTVDLDGIGGFDDLDDLDDIDHAADADAADEQSSAGYAISASGHPTEAWTKDPPSFSETEASEPSAEPAGKAKRRWGRRKK
jgi:hypothetical protein